jgi:alpha/beta superfamily hydrolase
VAADARIRANSVLPARREPLELRTSDGLTLVGELALPRDEGPVASLICLHPLPTAGGMMDSQIFRKAAFRLPALARIAVLRFNTRGTTSAHGTSEGDFEGGHGEGYDLDAAVTFAVSRQLPNRWLMGWSFGTDIALMHGADAAVTGAILLSPPLRLADESHLAAWQRTGKSLVAIVPEHDDYLQPPEARERFAAVTGAEVVDVPGGKHLWVGQAEAVLDLIVARVNPSAAPLAREWHGEMTLAPPTVVPTTR